MRSNPGIRGWPGNVNVLTSATFQRISLPSVTLDPSADFALILDASDASKLKCASLGSLAFQSSYTSADQSLTLAGLITLAHGLGVRPIAIFPYLRCNTAELNWSVGDEMLLPNGADGGSGASNTVWAVYADATNVYIRVPSSAPIVANKTTGSYSGITPASWRLKVYAYV